MAIEASISPQPAVRPINDAERNRPDAQSRRDGRKRQEHERHEEAAPIPNERGELTGKVIDILA
ncbi:MAG: hypothetical protein ACM3Y9_08225 [Ignavibacteria bacterium]